MGCLEALGCFGSADQPEHRAWTDRRCMVDGLRCAELKGDGIEVLGSLGSNALGSETLGGEALAS